MLYINTGAGPRQVTAGDVPDAVWLDLVEPTEAERSAAERATRLRVPSRAEVSEIELSSRHYMEDGAVYLSMPYAYRAEDGSSHRSPVGFVLSKTHLISLRYAVLPAFDIYKDAFGRGGKHGSAETFVGLIEAVVDRLADVLERVAGDLDGLSRDVFTTAASKQNARRINQDLRALLTQVGRNGEALGNLRDSLLGLGRIVGYVQQACGAVVPEDLATRLATLKQDIASLNDYDQQLSNRVSFLLDAVLGFISIEQNTTFRVLTIVSVLGIPPTFVVGLYGMNFKEMPELNWAYGYPFAWAAILVSVLVPLVWFRVKGWV